MLCDVIAVTINVTSVLEMHTHLCHDRNTVVSALVHAWGPFGSSKQVSLKNHSYINCIGMEKKGVSLRS